MPRSSTSTADAVMNSPASRVRLRRPEIGGGGLGPPEPQRAKSRDSLGRGARGGNRLFPPRERAGGERRSSRIGGGDPAVHVEDVSRRLRGALAREERDRLRDVIRLHVDVQGGA